MKKLLTNVAVDDKIYKRLTRAMNVKKVMTMNAFERVQTNS